MSQFLHHETDPDFTPVLLESASVAPQYTGLSAALRQAFVVPLDVQDTQFDHLMYQLDR